MLVWLLVVVVVVWTAAFRYRRRNLYRLAARFQDVSDAVPVLGMAHKLAGSTEGIMNALQRYSYDAIENDGIVAGWLVHILYLLITDPVDLEYGMKLCLEKDDLHRFLREVIGNGGIFAPVSIWRRRRKILVPAFTPKVLDNFVELFSEHADLLAERLAERADSKPFRLWPYLSAYTLDSVCETAMGVKVNAQKNPNTPFLVAMNRVLNVICERIFHLWLHPRWLFRYFPQYTVHERCVKIMHEFTDEVIRNKREENRREDNCKKDADDGFDLKTYCRKSFLDLLISLSGEAKGYSDEELREEVITLTIAGTDTSAVAVGYTIKLLAMYPAVQDKVYQELYELFGDSDRPLVKEDLTQLRYLERVVKESLRLFPPVPFIIRKIEQDVKLPSGRILPAGCGMCVSIWGAHRDPKHWGPDADAFDPDRFLPERFKPTLPCSYMPFSNGPRNCVGYQYALMSMKTSIATLVRRYKVLGEVATSPIPRIRVKLDIMMKAVDGYTIALEKRQAKGTNGRCI